MRRLNLLVVAVVALVLPLRATAAAEDEEKDTKEVLKAIAALNEAFAKKDAKTIKGLMTDDHVAITPYYNGPATRAEQLKNLDDLDLKEYKAGKMAVRTLAKGVVQISYPLSLKGTYKGKPVPPSSYASAVWVKREGKWLEA